MNCATEVSLRVDARRQLFIDDWILESKHNVVRSLHSPKKHPDNPICFACRPWEGPQVILYGSVFYDEQDKLFKMWYMAGNKDREDPTNCGIVCYATSKEGLRWERPELELFAYRGNPVNNIVYWGHQMGDAKCRLLAASVIKDMLDPDPARRYKMLTWNYNDTD